MTNKPDKFPEWAMEDQIDPSSHQNNAIEPPIEKKQFGWNFQEKGARNWWNWLGRTVNLWINYLAERLNKPDSYTVTTLPDAALNTRLTIYVSNESGGAVLAFSDGTNWRRVTDRAIVS